MLESGTKESLEHLPAVLVVRLHRIDLPVCDSWMNRSGSVKSRENIVGSWHRNISLDLLQLIQDFLY